MTDKASTAPAAGASCKACHAPEDRADGMCAKCHRDRGDNEMRKKRKVGALLWEALRDCRAAEERTASLLETLRWVRRLPMAKKYRDRIETALEEASAASAPKEPPK